MICCLLSVLLARIQWDSSTIRRSARRPTEFDARDWIIFVAVLLLIGASATLWSWYTERRQRPKRCNSPRRLLWELCRAHELSWSALWLLWRLARYQGLTDPARLFVEPQRLSTANLAPEVRERSAEIDEIRFVLYADLDEPDPPEPIAVPAPAASRSPSAPTPPTPTIEVPPWPSRDRSW